MTRGMKERPILFSAPMVRAILGGRKTQTRRIVNARVAPWLLDPAHGWDDAYVLDPGNELLARCPYGAPGGRLWVRETWARLTGNGHRIVYRADGDDPRLGWDDDPSTRRPRMTWTPSIHMPRWASRITLEVTDVRVERLQAITEEDAVAEGVARHVEGATRGARTAFASLWDSLNGERTPWSTNPWVWVVGFRRLP